MMEKRSWILISIVIAAIIIFAIFIQNKVYSPKQSELPNPASRYCIDQGGYLSIITLKDGSQQGVCVFKDDSSCEEWAFYRGECTPKDIDYIKRACNLDEDCVPDSCCHPSGCIAKSFAPVCTGIFCSQECVPGTLDCGQGSCKCIQGLCGAVMNV